MLYRYDDYEPGQLQPEPGFADDDGSATGRLVSVSDRGSHPRFNYDARGRLRRTARQLAVPGSTGTDAYAPRWFAARTDYDEGDRITRRSSGADLPELLVGGTSEERYGYSPRGLPERIDSSYGRLVASAAWDAEGAPTRVVFGDARAATARFVYDDRHRLTVYQLIAPSVSGAPPIGYFDYRFPSYDAVGNPLVVQDVRIAWTMLPPEAAPVAHKTLEYDDLYRLIRADYAYKTADGTAPWSSPFAPELAAGDSRPVPLRDAPTRVAWQSFAYDGLGNLAASLDDLAARFDRSLGASLGYGSAADGPDQLRSGAGFRADYDPAGNMTTLALARGGACPAGVDSACAQWFAYDWDEVGQLARARRWDIPTAVPAGETPPPAIPAAQPAAAPDWDLAYAYSQGRRVRKSATDVAGRTDHTLQIFDTLRADRAACPALRLRAPPARRVRWSRSPSACVAARCSRP